MSLSLLEIAIGLALKAHQEQIDSDGDPHILHSLEVMVAVKKELECDSNMYDGLETAYYRATKEQLLVAAVLHDVVEDTDFSLDQVRKEFGDAVANIVDSVTRREIDGKKEFYRDFIYRARASKGGRLVKIADLLTNLKRLPNIKVAHPKWHDKLQYKYHLAQRVLQTEDDDVHLWEKLSWEITGYDPRQYFMADPDGKRKEISSAEFTSLFSPDPTRFGSPAWDGPY
jgi:GTP pyrophosphokinase